MKTAWTTKEDAHLKRLIANGCSYEGASRILKRTPNSIAMRLARIKAKTEPKTVRAGQPAFKKGNDAEFLRLLHKHHGEKAMANARAFDDGVL